MLAGQTKTRADPVYVVENLDRPRENGPPTGPPLGAGDPGELVATAYATWAGELYRYALMLTADHEMAGDALQQAFLKLARMGRRVLKINSCAHYLRTAVRNECWRLLERRRRHRRETQLTEARPLVAPVGPAGVDRDERRKLEGALRALPADQRAVVHLKVYEGRTFQQIADSLRVSINTAASRYRYAVRRLRILLAPTAQRNNGQTSDSPYKSERGARKPFIGHGLRYQHGAVGYTVYSVGPDGADDQGDVDGDVQKKPRDVGIRVRPAVIRDGEPR
jgi:RNA polymerase sigma-70 factor (ECF subfamily)